jgi:hypothetical protein
VYDFIILVHHHRQRRECKTTVCFIAFVNMMYQSPIATHGFNQQSLHHQPVSDLQQINEIIWNSNNQGQQMNGVMPHGYSVTPNHQSVAEYGGLEKQMYSSLTDPNGITSHPNNIVRNNYGNSLGQNVQSMTNFNTVATRRMYNPCLGYVKTKFLFRI